MIFETDWLVGTFFYQNSSKHKIVPNMLMSVFIFSNIYSETLEETTFFTQQGSYPDFIDMARFLEEEL